MVVGASGRSLTFRRGLNQTGQRGAQSVRVSKEWPEAQHWRVCQALLGFHEILHGAELPAALGSKLVLGQTGKHASFELMSR